MMMDNDDAWIPESARPGIRIVGFKVTDASPSPTSVMTARSVESPTSSASSPRSKLGEALRREAFNPLPRLKIKAVQRLQGPGFKRSYSHADLPARDCAFPPTPGSRTSTASTPMRIPSALTRVKTCPMQLVDMASLDSNADVAATIPAAGSLSRRASEEVSSDDEVDGTTLARDLYAAGAFRAPGNGGFTEIGGAADADADAVAPGLGDLQAEMQRLHVQQQYVQPYVQHTAPAPGPRMLRLPAAAVHRRARSDIARRLSPSSSS